MRKRFTKPVLVGTLTVVVSAIVAGPAFGGVFVSGDSQKQGYPPSQHVQQSTFIPGYSDFPNVLRYHSTLTPTERQQLDAAVEAEAAKFVHQPGVTSGPAALPPQVMIGNGEFPNLRSLESMLTPAERRQLDAVAAAARSNERQQGSTFVPGYSDFPNVLRLHSTLTPTERRQLDAAVARSNSKASFVPGFTDFPNALRLHSTLTPTERQQLDAAVASTSSVSSSSGSDFSWSDAGIGIGIGIAIAGGLALVAVVGIRRNRATPVPA
jgi:hypothetical protein